MKKKKINNNKQGKIKERRGRAQHSIADGNDEDDNLHGRQLKGKKGCSWMAKKGRGGWLS